MYIGGGISRADAIHEIEILKDIASKSTSLDLGSRLAKYISLIGMNKLRDILALNSYDPTGNRRELESKVFDYFMVGSITDTELYLPYRERRVIYRNNIKRSLLVNNKYKIDSLDLILEQERLKIPALSNNIADKDDDLKRFISRSARIKLLDIEEYNRIQDEASNAYSQYYDLEHEILKIKLDIIRLNLEYSEVHKDYLLELDEYSFNTKMSNYLIILLNNRLDLYSLTIESIDIRSFPGLVIDLTNIYNLCYEKRSSVITELEYYQSTHIIVKPDDVIKYENDSGDMADDEYLAYIEDTINENIDEILRIRFEDVSPEIRYDNIWRNINSTHKLQFKPSSYGDNWVSVLRNYGLVVLKVPNFRTEGLVSSDIIDGIRDTLNTISDNSIVVGNIEKTFYPKDKNSKGLFIPHYYTTQNHRDDSFSTINFIIFSEDSGPNDGGFSYIERSQNAFGSYVYKTRIRNENPNTVDDNDILFSQYKRIKLCIRAGYMVLFDGRLSHMMIPSTNRDIYTDDFSLSFN